MINAFFLLLFVLFAFSERVLAIELGDYRVGLFDASAFIYVLISILLKKKISIKTLFLVFIICVVQILAFLKSSSISYTASFTIAIKIFLVYFLFSKQIKSSYLMVVGVTLFFLLTIVLVVFSDGAPIYPTEYFNRNETLTYLLMSVFIIDEKYIKTRLLLLLVLMGLTFIVESRQIMLSLFIVLFFSLFFSTKISVPTKIFIVSSSVLIILFVIPLVYSNYDDYTLRRYNIISELFELDFENINEAKDVTQGDKFRILNIMSGIRGWLQSPFYGHGLGSYVRLNEFGKVAHNTYITLLFEGGLLLFSVFIYLIKIFSRYLNNSLTTIIFFSMLVSLNFIESLGKFPIYIYFGILFMGMSNNRSLKTFVNVQ
jgi:hypothetical protein